TAPLATPTGFAAFLAEQRAREWVVYAKRPFGSPEQVLKYLARYTHRVAISDARIIDIQDAGVTFRYRDNTRGPQIMTLDGVEFLRRFLLHVLPTGFVRIRYFGLLANRHRADSLARCRALLAADPAGAEVPAPSAQPPPKPAEQDRGRCPCCSIGRLRHVGLIDPTPVASVGA